MGITRPRPDGGVIKKTGITRPRPDGGVKNRVLLDPVLTAEVKKRILLDPVLTAG